MKAANTDNLSLQDIRRFLRRPAVWAVLLTAIYVVALATQATPYLLGNEEWRWHARTPGLGVRRRCWPALALLVAYVVFSVWWIERWGGGRSSRRREWALLGFLLLMAPAIQLALKSMRYPYPLEFYLYRTIGSHNGFWQTAVGIDELGAYLSTYPDQMISTQFGHLTTHPPGDILYIWLWRKALEQLPTVAHAVAQYFRTYNCRALWFVRLEDAQIASALAQITIPLLSGLPIVPLYLLGRRVSSSRAALRAAALYVVLPSLTVFTIRWDQLYPLLMCLSLYWLHLGLERRRLGFFLLAGLSCSLASFMSFGNLTILLALGAYGLAHMLSAGPRTWWRWLQETWRGWALLALGAASIWIVYQAAYGVSFWDVFSTSMATHLYLGRSYGLWVGWNLYDFLTFLGVPIAVFLVAEVCRAWRSAIGGAQAVGPDSRLVLAVSAALLIVDLSGVVRGEVGRMWLLWMPVVCLLAANYLTRCDRPLRFALVITLVAAQTFFFGLFVRMDATGMRRFEPRRPNTSAPTVGTPLEARLGDDIALIGYDLEPTVAEAGGTVDLTLYWQALGQPERPYTVFTHLVDETGELQGQQDNMPVGDTLPTTCWQPGEFITDTYEIPVSPDAPPGRYTVRVGMYDLRTGERLAVSAAGHRGDSLSLEPIQVRPPDP